MILLFLPFYALTICCAARLAFGRVAKLADASANEESGRQPHYLLSRAGSNPVATNPLRSVLTTGWHRLLALAQGSPLNDHRIAVSGQPWTVRTSGGTLQLQLRGGR